MICPFCANDRTTVLCTTTDLVVERYRKCLKCGATFATIETVKITEDLTEYKKIQEEAIKIKKQP